MKCMLAIDVSCFDGREGLDKNARWNEKTERELCLSTPTIPLALGSEEPIGTLGPIALLRMR